jgi:hypothetical protein
MILSGCTAGRTGTHIEPSFEEISRIKKVGLCIKVEKGFAVRLQYISNADQIFFGNLMSATLAGGFIGAAMAVFGEFSPDKQATREIRPDVAQIESPEAIGRAQMDRIRITKVFPSIVVIQPRSVRSAKQNGIDALFFFTIRRWGLRPPLGSKYDIHETGDKAQATLELDMNLKLASTATGKILWERDEFYVDSQSYSLGAFKSQKKLLVDRLEYALYSVCDWTANELSITR